MPETPTEAAPQLTFLMGQLIDRAEPPMEINDLSTFAGFLRAVAKARGIEGPILRELAVRARVDRIFLNSLLEDERPAHQRRSRVPPSQDSRYPRLATALGLDPDLFVQLACAAFPPTEVVRSKSVLELLVDETVKQISAIYREEGKAPDAIAAKKEEVKTALRLLLFDALGTKQAAGVVLERLERSEIPGMEGRAERIRGRGLLIS